ncbi:LysR family transcriptional regulator [Photobacterium satsumensis]|uniref:LysR family transcriptional regulator n=1 Tax=Photobacterium satsumensis TaxID=2910239 RepID=UPI003D10D5BC
METLLDLDLLKTFVAVAETGEIKLAAKKVYRSSGAVSMQMKRLQELAGCELLVRTHRGVALTDAGKVLLSRSQQMLALNNSTLAALSEKDISGQLTFGIPTDYAADFTRYFMPLLQAKMPNLAAKIVCDRSRHLRKKRQAGTVDIAIVSGEPGIKDGMPLWNESINWVKSPTLALYPGQAVPIALFDGDCLIRDLALATLENADIRYDIVFTSPVLDNIAEAVYNGLAVSLLPESLSKSGQIQPFLPSELHHDIFTLNERLNLNLIYAQGQHEHTIEIVSACFIQAHQQLQAKSPNP